MNTPTKITFTRIVMIIIMMITLFVLSFFPELPALQTQVGGINVVMLVTCVFFLLASATDWLDGYLARKNNQVTDLGKFLDPVADKLLINSLVIFLIAPSISAGYAGEAQVGFNIWCAILLISRDIVVDALRFIAAQKNVVIAANIFGKAKTVLEMAAITFILLNGFPFNFISPEVGYWVATGFEYLATAVSVISGIIYVVQNRKVFMPNKEVKENE